METYIVSSFLHVLEGSCYSIAFDVFLNKCAVLYRTFFACYSCNLASENYVISCSVRRFCISNGYCGAFYFHACNSWFGWCDCCNREWVSIRPFTEYFFAIFITCPSMAVCVIYPLIYVLECCICSQFISIYYSVIFVCDAVFVFGNYIIVTNSAFRLPGKNNSRFVSNNCIMNP